MYGEPNWLASYLAKKMTRRAFSVYRSNICPHPDVPSHLCRKHLSHSPVTTRDLSGKKPFCPAGPSVTEVQQCRTEQTYLSAHIQQTQKPEPFPPAKRLIQRSGQDLFR